MFCASSVEAKLAELDREEDQWNEERAKMTMQIEVYRKIVDEWPLIKEALFGQLRTLEGEVAKLPESEQQHQETEVDKDQPAGGPAKPATEVPERKPAKTRGKLKKKRGARAAEAVSRDVDQENVFGFQLKHTLIQHLDCVRCVALHQTLPYLASGSDDGTIRLTNLDPPKKGRTRKAPVQFMSLRGHSGPVLTLAARNNQLFSGDVDGHFCVWEFGEMRTGLFDAHGRANHHLLFEGDDHDDALWSIAAHEKAPYCVTASADGTVRTYDCQTFHSDKVDVPDAPTVVSFTSDGANFAVGFTNGKVRVYSTETKTERAVIDAGAYVLAICPAPVSSQLLFALDDKNIKLYDFVANEQKAEFVAHSKATTDLVVLSGGAYLATTSSDGDIRVWKMGSFEIAYAEAHHRERFGEAGLCMAATQPPNTHMYFVSGGADGAVRVFSA